MPRPGVHGNFPELQARDVCAQVHLSGGRALTVLRLSRLPPARVSRGTGLLCAVASLLSCVCFVCFSCTSDDATASPWTGKECPGPSPQTL